MTDEELINVGKALCEMQTKINNLEKENAILRQTLDTVKQIFEDIKRVVK